jgi:hypothetical protein
VIWLWIVSQARRVQGPLAAISPSAPIESGHKHGLPPWSADASFLLLVPIDKAVDCDRT